MPIPKVYLFVGILSLLVCGNTAHAQLALDKEHLAVATEALDIAHNCDRALGELRLVSDSGRKAATYLLSMAKAYDCQSNTAKALQYYRQYIDKNPGEDSVKKRIAELTDENKNGASTQSSKAKAIYNAVKKGYTHKCISESDFVWGLNGNFYTGGKRTPHKTAIGFTNIYQSPFAKKHIQFEFESKIVYLTGGQKSWFAQALGVPASSVTKVPGTFGIAINVSVAPVIINRHAIALTVGPTLGVNACLMSYVDVTNASNEYSSPIMGTLTYGIKSALYAGRNFYTSLEYSVATRSSYSNELNTSTVTVPFKGNYLCVMVGIRGFGFPTYYRY